ncbi:MAG: glycosyltransferase family 9 protein [Schleiferiaceae bacterium]
MADKAKRHLGVVRFSAFGDVVLLHSVLSESAAQGDRITLFTRPRWAERLPAHPQIEVHGLDVDRGPYRRFFGLLWFWWGWMRSADLTAWYDGHSHVRTRSSRFIAWVLRIPQASVAKPRAERRALLRGGSAPVPNAYELHRAALAALGWPRLHALPATERSGTTVLIAPFASRETKRWPLAEAAELARQLAGEGYEPVFLGGPGDQAPQGFRSAIGSSPAEEVALWRSARAAVVCDSAAQHLAYRYQTPAVTVWAGTHPLGGFAAPSPVRHVLDSERLSCQPCSILGADSCRRGDWACRQKLRAEVVREALRQLGI